MAKSEAVVIQVGDVSDLKGEGNYWDKSPDFKLVREGLQLEHSGLLTDDWNLGPDNSPVVVATRGGGSKQQYRFWFEGRQKPEELEVNHYDSLKDKVSEAGIIDQASLSRFDEIHTHFVNFPHFTSFKLGNRALRVKVATGDSCWVLIGVKKINLGDAGWSPSR